MNLNASFFQHFDPLKPILLSIKQAGGIAYLVGGSVRDLVINRPLKDFDIEVHGLTVDELETVLRKHGQIKLVGKKFGVLRLLGFDVDWSLPRTDSKGRKPDVELDPHMGIEQACRRRDVTMNAMAINLNEVLDICARILRDALWAPQDERKQTGINSENLLLTTAAIESPLVPRKCEAPSQRIRADLEDDANIVHIIDPYGGLDDIKHKRLRAVDEKLFLEDPLRFFRVMQFIGRFDMSPDDALNQLCTRMDLWDSHTNAPLARERIFEEIKKLLTLSHRPSLGLRWLLSIGRLKEIFPELAALVGIGQSLKYHPEGDVFEHTMQAIDAGAQLTDYYDSINEKCMIIFGILCHDLGKATTTDEQFHAYGHEEAGVNLSKQLLKRITDDVALIKSVGKLVRYHMLPFIFLLEGSSSKAYKRLAIKLAPEVTLRQLGLIALADRQGRNGKGHEPLTDNYHDLFATFLDKAKNASVAHGPEAPILLGRHLLDVVKPGPELGKYLDEAYRIQIDEGIHDVDELRRRVLEKI